MPPRINKRQPDYWRSCIYSLYIFINTLSSRWMHIFTMRIRLYLMSGENEGRTPFVTWMLHKLDERGWTREELARQTNTSSSVITNIVKGNAAIGVDVARRIAVALDVPQRILFVIAGLMDDEDIDDAKEEDQIREIRRVAFSIEDDDERQRALDIAETVLKQIAVSQKKPKAGKAKRTTRADNTSGQG